MLNILEGLINLIKVFCNMVAVPFRDPEPGDDRIRIMEYLTTQLYNAIDMTWLQGAKLIGFQDPASPIMEGIIDLHNYIFTYLIFIIILVLWILICIHYDFYHKIRRPWYPHLAWTPRKELKTNRAVNHGSVLEVIWTITPSFILLAIAIPSFTLLYSMEETMTPSVTIKAIGHQWYWSYEISDQSDISHKEYTHNMILDPSVSFDSNMLFEEELQKGEFRLLQVDNPIILPAEVHIRIIVTSADVLHSWAMPALGIKIDGVPGRLNQVFTFIKREGVFYGQCSELCGVNHGFMPIVIKAVSVEDFIQYLATNTK